MKLTSESSYTSCSIDNTNCCVDLYPPLLSQIICHFFCFKHLRSYTKHARHFVASFLTRFCVTPLETIQILACKCCLRFNIKIYGFRYLKSRLIEIFFSKYVQINRLLHGIYMKVLHTVSKEKLIMKNITYKNLKVQQGL